MKLKNYVSVLWLFFMVLLIGCSSKTSSDNSSIQTGTADSKAALDKYKDGTYEVETKPDYEGYITKAKVTIKKDKITNIEWGIFDANRNNKPFDEKYEEVYIGNENYIQQCREDWKGSRTYSPELIETQDPNKVDAVSGATWTNNKFKEIVAKALESAANN